MAMRQLVEEMKNASPQPAFLVHRSSGPAELGGHGGKWTIMNVAEEGNETKVFLRHNTSLASKNVSLSTFARWQRDHAIHYYADRNEPLPAHLTKIISEHVGR